MKRRKTRQHKSRKGEERKSSRQLFGVFFELSGVLYLYGDFITVLAKIATTVTLMDKIKMEFIH